MIERRVRNVAWLVAGCFFMEMLDATIVVTSIPQISSSLHTAPDSAGLIVTSYLVTLAVLIPLSAWLTRRFGYRRVFLSAIVIFTLASLGCAASQTLAELVAMRVVQGIGGAMMVPVGRLIVFDGSDRSQLMRLMSYIVWPGLIAPVIAPLAGGVITTYASWQWLFLINVPLGAIAFVAGWRLVHGAPAGAPPRLDRLGVVLTCTGLGGLTYTAHLASAQEPDLAAVAALGIASVVLIAAAAVHLLRADAPLVDLRTLRIHTLRVGTAAASLYFMVISAIPFLLPLLFQTVFGWSAIKSGSLVLFIFVGNVAIKPATTVIYRRGGFRRTLVAASITLAATAIVCATFSDGTPLSRHRRRRGDQRRRPLGRSDRPVDPVAVRRADRRASVRQCSVRHRAAAVLGARRRGGQRIPASRPAPRWSRRPERRLRGRVHRRRRSRTAGHDDRSAPALRRR